MSQMIIDKDVLIKMARLIDRSDIHSKNHFEEVKEIAIGIGNELGLKEDDIRRLEIMVMIHDIGRVGFHKEIKKIMLEMEDTTNWQDVVSRLKLSDVIANLDRIKPTLGHYYEFFEKEGSKRLLSLREIVAVADAYIFLISSLPLKDRCSPDEAFDNLEKEKRFDTNILNALWIAQDRKRLLREEEIFLQMKEELLIRYPEDKFVAISDGKVIDSGNNDLELAMKYTHIPIYIGQLRGEREVIYMPSPKGV